MASPTRSVRSVRSAKARPKAPSPKKKAFHFQLESHEEPVSPKLMPFEGSFASALMPPNEDAAGRFCTEGPKLEFGGPMSQTDPGHNGRVPLRQFAVRLQSAIAQAATLLVDRHQMLTRRSGDFTATQEEEMVKLSQGVQAASYCVQKWAHALGHGDGLPFRPSPPQTVEEALAMMNMALPRLVVAASSLQSGLRDIVPPPAAVEEEDMEEARHEAELCGEEELRRRGIAVEDLYSVVPHVEHLIYQASSLLNSLRSHAYGPVVKVEPPYEGAAVPAM